jgi:hypothetical protein
MARRAIRTMAVLAGLLAMPAAASAAWTDADTISPFGASVFSPQVATDNSGNSVSVWVRSDASGNTIQARRRAAGGSLAAAKTLSPTGAYGPQVAVGTTGVGLVVWGDGLGNVVGRSWSSSGSVGSIQQISPTGQVTQNPQVAVDSSGNAIVIWEQFDGSNWRTMSRRRSSGGTFGSTKTLSASGQDASVSRVATEPNGDAIVIWLRYDGSVNRVQARTVSSTDVVGATQNISGTTSYASQPQVDVDLDGDATIVWRQSDGANDRVLARHRAPAGTLSSTQTLSGSGANANAPAVAVDDNGDAVVVWDRLGQVQLRARTVSGTLSSVQYVTSTGTASGQEVAVDSTGNAVIVWHRNDGTGVRTEARRRTSGGTLQPITPLSGYHAVDVGSPQVAGTSAGGATALWLRNDGDFDRAEISAGP